jgi:replicative DNA helicase
VRPLESDALGIALMDPRGLALLDDLRAEDFTDPVHRSLWNLILSLARGGETVTPSVVMANVDRLDDPQAQRLARDVIIRVTGTALGWQAAETIARQIKRASGVRRIADALIRGQQLAEGADDPDTLLEDVLAEIQGTQVEAVRGRALGAILLEARRQMEEPTRAEPTPWADLNILIRGWRPGGLYVVGARPGVGKSIMGLQAAVHLARRGPVAFNSLEMPDVDLGKRVLAADSRVPLERMDGLGDGRVEPTRANLEAVDRSIERLSDLPLFIEDRPKVSATDVRSFARRTARRGPLAGVVVDYLQLMDSERSSQRARHEIVADFSRQMKILAKEQDCPVIALSQLNRNSATEGKAPNLAELRESGSIEQDADCVILLHQELIEGEPREDQLKVIIAKNRQGRVGTITLDRDGSTSTLSDHQWRPYDNIPGGR